MSMLYVSSEMCNISSLAVATLVVKLLLLMAEAQSKRVILREPYQGLSPEETAGVLSMTFFWWVNSLLRDGYSRILSIGDLPPILREISSESVRDRMQKSWDTRGTS